MHIGGSVTHIDVVAVEEDGTPKTVRFDGVCDRRPNCTFSVLVEDHGEGRRDGDDDDDDDDDGEVDDDRRRGPGGGAPPSGRSTGRPTSEPSREQLSTQPVRKTPIPQVVAASRAASTSIMSESPTALMAAFVEGHASSAPTR